jgi:16S rRNA (adenine1518-N6/adenine1519-N6)-dimethyltransferase
LGRIIIAADLGLEDRVLEIGPGLGPLTARILERTPRLLAIEKDLRLVEHLREKFGALDGFELRAGDAMEILRTEPRDWSEWKVVSNLPYSVASPILVALADAPGAPRRIVATLQLEVARRVAAAEDTEAYGLLSLLLQLHYRVAGLFKIPATCFFPAPEVDSACVTLVRRETPLLTPAHAPVFSRVVKRGFSQRRKMMMKLLREDWPETVLAAAYQTVGLAVSTRAEAVSLFQFVALTRILAESGRGK